MVATSRTPFGIHFSLLCVWQRVTGTPGPFLEGRGRLIILSPQGSSPIFHTRVSAPAPVFVWPLPQWGQLRLG